MNYKNILFRSLLLSLLAFAFISCSGDDETTYDPWTPPLTSTQGAFILNGGSFNIPNSSSLSYYDKKTGQCNPTVFESSNGGLKLGDTAQDFCIAGNNMYIAVYGSGVIYVTDMQGKKVKTIVSTRDKNTQMPRYLTADDTYVYVTYFDGYLARIKRSTMELEPNQLKVGNNPEDVVVYNGKIYVANSGGLNFPNYDKAVSVIDAKTFTKERDVSVIINPTRLEVDRKGNVYVISMGNYGFGEPKVYNTLQRINADYSVDVLGNANIMRIDPKGDKLYTIYAQSGATSVSYKVYDVDAKKYLDGSFVAATVNFAASPSTLNIDPATNNLYIGTSDYRTNDMMYIISSSTGTLVSSFNTGGLNTQGAFFIK